MVDIVNSCLTISSNFFFDLSLEDFMNQMETKYIKICGEKANDLQIMAWKDCYETLHRHLSDLKNQYVYLVFEYVLPREGGRRPDLLIITSDEVIVFEFKMKSTFKQADIDQANSYARDIQHYHTESHSKKVIPYLIPTKSIGKRRVYNNVIAISPDLLLRDIESYYKNEFNGNIKTWLNSNYEPLPSIIEAAKLIYNHKKLPNIRRANSGGLPKTLEEMQSIVQTAQKENKKVLILVTGIPGSGKTLLGLEFVYKTYVNQKTKSGVLLSGNGPLVQVLQDALSSKVFVQPLRNFVRQYGFNRKNISPERIIVFDEAQRAWDREHVKAKHNYDASEPELLIEIADRIPGWTVILGLIGEGQEIHIGEESGIQQWREAVSKSKSEWEVYMPGKLQPLFQNYSGSMYSNDKLNLNTSLRSHLAEGVSQFATLLINGSVLEAQQLLNCIYNQGFQIYLTRDLNKAKRYVQNRYEKNLDKRYGLIASSRSKILQKHGVDTSFKGTRAVNIAKWFNEQPESPLSGCRLNAVVTEFGCQGLELDFPVVCWGEDLVWKNNKWSSDSYVDPKAKDSHLLRINSYRVLLTRGRDGMIIFIPKDKQLDETYFFLKSIGFRSF